MVTRRTLKYVMFTITALLRMMMLAPVSAVNIGSPEGDAHPHVGLLIFDTDGVPSHRCSGTLISPTVMVICRTLHLWDIRWPGMV